MKLKENNNNTIQINIFFKDIIEIRINNKIIYKNKIGNRSVVFDVDFDNYIIY